MIGLSSVRSSVTFGVNSISGVKSSMRLLVTRPVVSESRAQSL